ncbi:MAG TPA: SLBB domain-containing protein [Ignavibacteriaceae bacterium]|nr:SLBB domain-containing protein [Ignavibacteriaceae bacterium]
MLKNVLLVFILFGLLTSLAAQTSQQIQQKLKQEGISTKTDVDEELKKRNMTEDDARRLAKQYGMDYDSFIATYILSGNTTPLPPAITNITNSPDSSTKNVTNVIVSSGEQNTVPVEEIKVDRSPTPTDGGLEYFGYNLFKNIPSSFEPSEIGPIDPGYLIGPGDNLRLSIWGAAELQYQLTVDAQGNIFIPTAGQIFVSGISYELLQNKLTAYLSKFYEGLTSEPPTIFLDVSLSKLKPIKIFVTGEVAQPGGYNISSFATVFNALYSVGGPLTSGSLREIRVIRNNKVLTSVDIYDYILKGQLIGDVRLQNNDMIFIPPRKKSVSITGEIFRPAIYELKEGEKLQKMIEFAGGLNATAYTGRVQINRIIPFDKRQNTQIDREYIDADISSVINKSADIPLYDKDIITVFPILNKLENFVTIEGSVYRPGTYESSTVKNLRDLLKKSGGELPETYYGKVDVIRTRPDESNEFISVDLAKALQGDPNHNITLQPRDKVKTYSIYELVDRKNVSISGYVKQNVTLPYADSLTLFDMVFRAGGLQDPFFRGRAFILRGDLIRVNPDGVTTRIIPFDLEKLLHDQSFNMQLQPGDKIYIYSASVEKVLDKYVIIEGEVNSPGKFPLNSNMTVMDLILQAGGFNEQSLRTEVYVSRLRPGGYPGDKISETYTVQLPLFFTKSSNEIGDSSKTDFKLQYKDVVVVRKNPNYTPQRVVRIIGDVNYPGAYVLERKSENLLELIRKAGGPTSEAFLFGSTFTREGRRLVIDLEKLFYGEDEDHDVILNNGDEIFIPRKPNTVFVTGEVNNPGLYKYIPGDNIKDYIDKAGGETDSSNYILYSKANGETDKVGFGWFSGNPTAYDGSVIVVTKEPPPLVEKDGPPLWSNIKDIFAIAVSAVTIIVLALQIK